MFAGKKIAMQMSFGSNKICKFCTMFWTPKWGLKNGPKNGARICPPKWGPKMAPKRGPNIWGSKHGAKFAKKFAAKAHLQSKFFHQTCITKCICSHCLASCIPEHNPILHLAKPLKVLIATNVAHEQDGLKPQNLIQ